MQINCENVQLHGEIRAQRGRMWRVMCVFALDMGGWIYIAYKSLTHKIWGFPSNHGHKTAHARRTSISIFFNQMLIFSLAKTRTRRSPFSGGTSRKFGEDVTGPRVSGLSTLSHAKRSGWQYGRPIFHVPRTRLCMSITSLPRPRIPHSGRVCRTPDVTSQAEWVVAAVL